MRPIIKTSTDLTDSKPPVDPGKPADPNRATASTCKITRLPTDIVSTTKILKTREAARRLGVDGDSFPNLARKAGVEPRTGRYGFLWSEADVELVRSRTTR